jgi:hypothetical protein
MFLIGALVYCGTVQSNTFESPAPKKTSYSKQNLPSHNTFDFVELEETEDDFQEQNFPNLPAPDSKIIFGFAYLLLIFSAFRIGQSFDRPIPYYLAFENLRI